MTTTNPLEKARKPPIVRRVYYQTHPTRTDGSTVFRVLRLPEGACLILFDIHAAGAWLLVTLFVGAMLFLMLQALPS